MSTVLTAASTSVSGFLEHKIIEGGGDLGLATTTCALTSTAEAALVKPFICCGHAAAGDKVPFGGPISVEWTDPFVLPAYLTSGRGRGGLGSANQHLF